MEGREERWNRWRSGRKEGRREGGDRMSIINKRIYKERERERRK